ncbi:peptidoglycan endopeptidase [Sphingomonas aquatica]|uniref:peptidoglycan endopeptidase n=1 Tax=Sphingomonas aquatica TaxID=1763824 RepID=UPI00301D1B57
MNIVERARSAVGARFRLHGREAATGLDCVGLAALAYGEAAVPSGYALRGGDPARVAALIEARGLVAAVDVRAGDLLLCASGPGQLHLAIDSGGGVIHADAMLRRVVERPGPVPWTVIGRWRLKGED